MEPLASDKSAAKAAKHLLETDPVLAPVIKQAGLYPIRPHTLYYQRLVESIIGQQLSVKAAASIKLRFNELFGGHFPSPSEIIAKSVDELRTAGLSRAKAVYVRDLAQHDLNGQLDFDKFPSMTNAAVIQELTAVKGIGEWTAHMFLIFAMGRLDVLATGDLGIRTGIKNLYDLNHLPIPDEVRDMAIKNQWHPYESVACWYIWHSLDNAPA